MYIYFLWIKFTETKLLFLKIGLKTVGNSLIQEMTVWFLLIEKFPALWYWKKVLFLKVLMLLFLVLSFHVHWEWTPTLFKWSIFRWIIQQFTDFLSTHCSFLMMVSESKHIMDTLMKNQDIFSDPDDSSIWNQTSRCHHETAKNHSKSWDDWNGFSSWCQILLWILSYHSVMTHLEFKSGENLFNNDCYDT